MGNLHHVLVQYIPGILCVARKPDKYPLSNMEPEKGPVWIRVLNLLKPKLPVWGLHVSLGEGSKTDFLVQGVHGWASSNSTCTV